MQINEPVNLLVVDDIQNNLEAMSALLAQPGVHVLRARSGEEALELLLQHDVALALLDVNMPGMDGFALAELMRGNSKTRHIPLIFITAALHEPRRTFAGYRSGAVDFLYKPFVPDILLSKVKVFVDMYLQKKLLAVKVAELQEALRINEMFVAVLGHDLRTPLAAIVNGSELISMLSNDEKISTAAHRICSSGMRMESMVRQLLDTASIRSGQIKLNVQPGDYRSLVDAVINEVKWRFAEASIKLMNDGDTTGDFDHDRLAQVVSNLIGNAIEHGEQGRSVVVFIDGTAPEKVVVDVRNDGVIPASKMPDIFEPFQSGRQRQNGASGLGLGLYVVKNFVEAHCGKIDVQSSLVQGTVFRIELPRRPAQQLT